MVFPIHDLQQPNANANANDSTFDNKQTTVNIILIVLNVTVYLFYAMMPNLQKTGILDKFAFISTRFWESPSTQWYRLFSSNFLHSGLSHLMFNLSNLYVFGNDVEHSFGGFWYSAFYLLCGSIANLAHAYIYPENSTFLIGASGAISGIMGAYSILFPNAQIHYIGKSLKFTAHKSAIGYFWNFILFQMIGLIVGKSSTSFVSHVFGYLAGILLTKIFFLK